MKPNFTQSPSETAGGGGPWAPRHLEDGASLLWHCGPMQIHARRGGADWSLASRTINDHPDKEQPEDVATADWTHWPLGREESVIRFRPVLPDRPLVVKPENPLMIPTSVEVSFFISIPVSVEVLAGKDDARALTLATYPSLRLSDTWFGSKSDGSLCYALKTPARRRIEDVVRAAHLALCPVLVVNQSKETLQCEMINVDGKFLEMYLGPEGLWTNPVKVSYQGRDGISQVDFDYHPPKGFSGLVQIAEARERPQRGFLRKTFRF